MSGPTTFLELRKLGDIKGREAMYLKGEELGHPCYSRTGARNVDQWTCPACKATVRRNDSDGTAFKPCVCLNQAYSDGLAQVYKQFKAQVLEAEKNKAGIQPLYMAATFDTFEQRQGTEGALRTCREYAENFNPEDSAGLILFGPSGSGKTHLATAVLHCIMDYMATVPVFVEAVQLLHEIRQRRDGGIDPVERCVKASLLVLDDLGNHQVTPFAQDQLYAIVSGRYSARRPTIITTNCDGPKLTELFGPAFRSRLYQMCKPVPVVADDYRKED